MSSTGTSIANILPVTSLPVKGKSLQAPADGKVAQGRGEAEGASRSTFGEAADRALRKTATTEEGGAAKGRPAEGRPEEARSEESTKTAAAETERQEDAGGSPMPLEGDTLLQTGEALAVTMEQTQAATDTVDEQRVLADTVDDQLVQQVLAGWQPGAGAVAGEARLSAAELQQVVTRLSEAALATEAQDEANPVLRALQQLRARTAESETVIDATLAERDAELALTERALGRQLTLKAVEEQVLHDKLLRGGKESTLVAENGALKALLTESSPATGMSAASVSGMAGATAGALGRAPLTAPQTLPPMPMPPQQPGWSEAVVQRLNIMRAQGMDTAEIRLDPPDLGSLEVRLSVHKEQVSVTFSTPHASVREALEQSVQRLREMFDQNGLELGNVDVSDQSLPQRSREGDNEQHLAEVDAEGTELVGEPDERGPEDGAVRDLHGGAVNLVDYYA